MVQFLCQHGANIDQTDTQVLHFIYQLLSDLEVLGSIIQGWTALMYAVDGGHGAVARTLLELGADPDIISEDGLRAADLAAQHSNPVLEEVLEKYSSIKGLKLERETFFENFEKPREIDSILLGLGLEEYKVVKFNF